MCNFCSRSDHNKFMVIWSCCFRFYRSNRSDVPC